SGPTGATGPVSDDVNECLVNNGGCSQLCVNTFFSYYCDCSPGYQLETINEDNCVADTQFCSKVYRAHGFVDACFCQSRLSDDVIPLNGTNCSNYDECSYQNGRCQHFCNDTEGSYVCTCRDGFELSEDEHECTDIDECARNTDNCGADETCVNTNGNHICIASTFVSNGLDAAPQGQVGAGLPANVAVQVSTLNTTVIGVVAWAVIMTIALALVAVIVWRKFRKTGSQASDESTIGSQSEPSESDNSSLSGFTIDGFSGEDNPNFSPDAADAPAASPSDVHTVSNETNADIDIVGTRM
ncbi:unnamed protein product, partial [Owenia fusiformis]